MYPLWYRVLDFFSALRIPLFFSPVSKGLSVGDPRGVDALGDMAWKKFCDVEKLFSVWGPHEGSIWEPYHCLPLFASLEAIERSRLGVSSKEGFRWKPEQGLDSWFDQNRATLYMIDLPGSESVAFSVWAMKVCSGQPVCTFDNWPAHRSLLKAEDILAALLFFAPVVANYRRESGLTGPPIWICDSQRLGHGPGKPKDFDNRYFLDDSILPGIDFLRQKEIDRVVYFCENSTSKEVADLSAYFRDLKKAGLSVFKVGVFDSPSTGLIPLIPQPPRAVSGGFFRSSAGGFGAPIPEPSSSSG